MPWKSLNNWFYDGDRKSPVPEILLKSNSPVSAYSLLNMFINQGPLNHYLNRFLNTVWVFSIERDELLKFFKKCIMDYKVKKGSTYFSSRPVKDKLHEVLKEKFVFLKNTDVSLLTDIISTSPEKESIFESLGIETSKIKKEKKNKPDKISQKNYIIENFSFIEVKE